MPNWVRAELSFGVTQEKVSKIKEEIIDKKGLCRVYNPMPEELNNHTAPARIISKEEYEKQQQKPKEPYGSYGITQEMYDDFTKRFGCADWYTWANNNWGTKWGDCNIELEEQETIDGMVECIMRWESAWAPIPLEYVERFLNQYGADTSSDYYWEEEQGFGESYKFYKRVADPDGAGYLDVDNVWDVPEWEGWYKAEKSGRYFTKLTEFYSSIYGEWEEGYYEEYDLYAPYDPEEDGLLVAKDMNVID